MNPSASGTATLERTASLDGTATPMLDRPQAAANPRIHRFAERMHQAIDGIQQRLGGQGDAANSARAKYGEQAREYGDKLRHRFDEHPLQTAGIAVAIGVVLDRLLLRRSPKVRIVRVPTPVQVLPAMPSTSARAGRAAGFAAGRTSAAGSMMAARAGTLPLQMRLATQRLLDRSHAYAHRARSGVQDHPYLGLGALAGASGLLTALWLQRRRPAPAPVYGAVDERGQAVAWREDAGGRQRYRERIAERPIGAALLLLGVGALAGAVLRARST